MSYPNFYLTQALNHPWKIVHEIRMLLLKPITTIYLNAKGVSVGRNSKFYGLPTIFRSRNSQIKIGDNFENRNWYDSNVLGINHPTIISTWLPRASIKIGKDVGISGGCLCAATEITVGDGTIIGANCTIIDTDFHATDSLNRRYEKIGVKSKPVHIGKNVFIGTGAILLKGVDIPDHTIIPAGAVVR